MRNCFISKRLKSPAKLIHNQGRDSQPGSVMQLGTPRFHYRYSSLHDDMLSILETDKV
jgi:hypothetical protein